VSAVAVAVTGLGDLAWLLETATLSRQAAGELSGLE